MTAPTSTHTRTRRDEAPTATAPTFPLAASPLDERVAAARGPRSVVALGDWLALHVRSIVLLSLALSAVAVVHADGMMTFPVRFDDEGTYVSQAWSLLTDGTLSPYTYWYDHPPFGWVQLSAWFGATGALLRAENAVAAGREAMLVTHLLSSGLLYVLARRLDLARPWALLAVALYTLSPLALSMHRMVFLDNVAMPWLIGAFVLACTPRRHLAAYVGSALCFAAAVLSKETLLLVLPALLYAVQQHTDRANRPYAWTIFGSVLALTGLLYPIYAGLNGELIPSSDRVSLIGAITFQLTRASGESGETITNWLQLDPWLLAGGALAAVGLIVDRRLRPYVLMVAIHAAVIGRPGYLPVPYVIATLFPAALLSAAAFDRVTRIRLHAARLRRLPAAAAVVALGVMAGAVGPTWAHGIDTARTYDQDRPLRAAQRWVTSNVAPDARLLVDNSIWLDLVDPPFPERNVVWFYKLDLDPQGVDFPDGWQEFDYIVATDIVRDSSERLPEIEAAIENSVVVARFGSANPVEVRRIHRDGVPERTVSDRQFVVDHYREFYDRTPTDTELTNRLEQLRSGTSRQEIIDALASQAYRQDNR